MRHIFFNMYSIGCQQIQFTVLILLIWEHKNQMNIFVKYLQMNILCIYCRPEESDLNRFGLNWAAVWVKMGSSWACVFIYLLTLFRPQCCPGRNLTFRRTGEVMVPGEGDAMGRESRV